MIINFVNRVILSLAYCAGFVVGFVQGLMRYISGMLEDMDG